MSTASVLLLLFLGVIVIGPSKLPAGAETLMLALYNLSSANRGMPEIDMATARRMWTSRRSPVYQLINLGYAAAEHLEELRIRMLAAAIWFLIIAIVSSIYADALLEVLRVPAGEIELIFIRPPEMFIAYFNVIVTAGILATMPIAIYQILLFVGQALEDRPISAPENIWQVIKSLLVGPSFESKEARKAFRLLRFLAFPTILFLFVGGVSFAYFIMLPVALTYLAGFGGSAVTAQWTISEYLKFVLNILVWVGVAFETPLVIMLLAQFGIVSAETMQKGWRIAFVVTAVMAAIITPTPDPLNMSIVWLPLFALYLLGVLLARIFGKRPVPEA